MDEGGVVEGWGMPGPEPLAGEAVCTPEVPFSGLPMRYLHSRALTWRSGTRRDFALSSGFGFFSADFLAV